MRAARPIGPSSRSWWPASTRRSRTAAYAVLRIIVPAAGARPSGQPERRRGRPVVGEQLRDLRNRGGGRRQERSAVARVADRIGEDLAELHRAVVAQEQQPRIDGTGDRGGEPAGAGHEVEPLGAEVLDGRRGRCRTLPDEDDGHSGRFGGGEDADQIAAGSVQVRLDDVQHEPAGDGRVERIAAALEHGLCGGRGEPVGRRGHAERPLQRGARREGRGRSEGHCAPRRSIHCSTSSAVRGIAADRFSTPSAVTSTSSSMRTPMPRSSSGTVRSSTWK